MTSEPLGSHRGVCDRFSALYRQNGKVKVANITEQHCVFGKIRSRAFRFYNVPGTTFSTLTVVEKTTNNEE